MPTLHDDPISGNGYKVRLMLALLGLPFDYVAYDILRGETRTPQFLKTINPNGRIPVLVLDDGTPLVESDAILCYLADGTDWWPGDRLTRAQVLSWLFFEQYSHEPFIAVLRFWAHLPELSAEQTAQLESKRTGGLAALDLMDGHLKSKKWLVGDTPTIADIALYAYTHVADEGGFRLDDFPAVQAWLKRIESLPGYVPMASAPTPTP